MCIIPAGCSSPAMNDDEIIDKAADILSKQGFDLYAALNDSGNEAEQSQDVMPTLPQNTESTSATAPPTVENTPEQTAEQIISDIGTRKILCLSDKR